MLLEPDAGVADAGVVLARTLDEAEEGVVRYTGVPLALLLLEADVADHPAASRLLVVAAGVVLTWLLLLVDADDADAVRGADPGVFASTGLDFRAGEVFTWLPAGIVCEMEPDSPAGVWLDAAVAATGDGEK